MTRAVRSGPPTAARLIGTLAGAILAGACVSEDSRPQVGWVDPRIGTAGHGNTFPGAARPFGMVQLSPDTHRDAIAGYRFRDRTIIGFSHTHLSGAGVPDLRDILFQPAVGARLPWVAGDPERPDGGYRSRFRHESELVLPGFYAVTLDDYRVRVELTATRRAGFHRYTFPESDAARLLVDLHHPGRNPRVVSASLTITGPTSFEGSRVTSGWARRRTLFFAAELSRPFDAVELARDDRVVGGVRPPGAAATLDGRNVKARFHFRTRRGERLLVKVGLSAVSAAQARKNLRAEIPGWDFERTRLDALAAWNRLLDQVRVEGGSRSQRRVFYTALYHAFLGPQLYMDVDGRYRGLDDTVRRASGFEHYTVLSLWDTFRNVHPLYTILQPRRARDMVRSLLAGWREIGHLPRWPLHGNETGEMIGYHGVSVIGDAYLKGIGGFSARDALAAMKATAERRTPWQDAYRARGYVPVEVDPHEGVSRTLEYAYDDWVISRVARALGDRVAAARYAARARSYRALFDPGSRFMRPRRRDGTFAPFDPTDWGPAGTGYTESTAWEYTFFVPHDVPGLIALFGGAAPFVARLDALFAGPTRVTGEEAPPPDGLVGMYNHGNQPGHHIPYLYAYAGAAWKTQRIVRRILTTLYRDTPRGLPGNDDTGEMSAWYVFSALGFYPVAPGSGVYVIGSPLFRRATLRLPGRRTFVIEAPSASARNLYVQGAELNGRELSAPFITHAEVMAGGRLRLHMGRAPRRGWGAARAGR